MDEYATKLMNEAININYIDETEYPRIAVMNGKCINIVANLWNSPEKKPGKPAHLPSVPRRHVCWVVWQPGCAGVRNVRRKANRSTNQLRYFNWFPGGMGKIRPIVAD